MVLPVMLRSAWRGSPLPAVIVPDAIGTETAAELRARLDGFARYALLDRASYELLATPREPELVEILTGIASEVTGRSLTSIGARVLRLLPGDYLLVRHDRVYEDRPVELVLDLSPTATRGAEVHWRHRGQVYFTMPSSPGSLAIVERGPTVMCNHTYVSKRNTDAIVVRFMMLLA